MRINTCQCCNREFEAKYKNKRYCPECDLALEKELKRKYAEQWRTGKKHEKRAEKAKPVLSIAEISKRAKAAGMTYGQYVVEMGKKG